MLTILLAFVAGVSLAGIAVLSSPVDAHAITKAEQTAFKRCVKAIEDYKSQPQSIAVDVADLGLTYKQICAVYDRVGWDGRYFWVNTFGKPPKTKKTITFNCIYSDKAITKMRKKFDKKIAQAMTWAPAEMSQHERVHMLHDWLMVQGGVWTHDGNIDHKLAYGSIVLGKGDCQSFTMGMNALLNSAGFTTDVAIIDTKSDDHAWSRVELGGVWYNVDATWDNSYTRRYPEMWEGGICHMYLLVNDSYMEKQHTKFKANNKNTKKSYAKKYLNKDWSKTNRKWMGTGSTFTCGNFTYKVLKGHKAKIVKCNKKKAASLTIPVQAAYRGHVYKITSIDKKALSGAKAKTLVVKAKTLTKSGLKQALSKSKLTKVQVKKASVSKAVYKKYATYFKKANSGKVVKLSYV